MSKKQSTIRGAGQCPRCGSRKVSRISTESVDQHFYAKELEVCGNPACKAAWEPFDPDQLLDEGVALSSFKEPCDNCAFRPGSPEQQNTDKWKSTIEDLKKGGICGGFYCHKGVPIDLENEHGFAYPFKDGKPVTKKMRPCRGWLRMLKAQMDKEKKNVPATRK